MDKALALSAINEMLSKVYLPTFLTKLASVYNIRPRSQEDIMNLVQIAAALNSAKPNFVNSMKKTAENSGVSVVIRDALNSLTKIANGISTEEVLKEGVVAKNIISTVKSDPSLYNAALLYGLVSTKES